MSESFLENIYEGHFDLATFEGFRPRQDDVRLQRITERFHDILKEYPPRTLEAEGHIPEDMLHKMGAAGLFGISIPGEYGGLGFNLWEYLRAVEAMAAEDIAVALASLAHLSIGVKGIVLFGTEAQKEKYLRPAASGEMIFSYALTEPGIGSDAQHIQTRAHLCEDGSHYLLNGQKTYITNANYAGGLTVFAQLDPTRPGFMGAFIVETGWEGVKIGADMPKMGLKASSTAAIQLNNVRVPSENLLGLPGDGFKIAMTILNYGRLGLGAASVGLMDQSLKDMMKRSSSRIQFGVPIKEFPLIQEKMVQARVHSFASAAMNDFTAHLLSTNPVAKVPIESSHCKLYGTTRAWDTLYEALQTAGGAGYLATLPYEKRMRDFRVATVFEGTTEIHSVYPSLSILRKIAKALSDIEGGKLARIRFVIEELFRRDKWSLYLEDTTMRKALKLARANAATIRRMLYLAAILQGKKAFQKELFLRRITTLSYYLFGLLSMIARISSAGRSTGSYNRDDLDLLAYFMEEAREARKQNRRFFDSKRETIHTRVFQGLFRA